MISRHVDAHRCVRRPSAFVWRRIKKCLRYKNGVLTHWYLDTCEVIIAGSGITTAAVLERSHTAEGRFMKTGIVMRGQSIHVSVHSIRH